MQLNEHWSHNVAVNVLINGLIDSELETHKKEIFIFYEKFKAS